VVGDEQRNLGAVDGARQDAHRGQFHRRGACAGQVGAGDGVETVTWHADAIPLFQAEGASVERAVCCELRLRRGRSAPGPGCVVVEQRLLEDRFVGVGGRKLAGASQRRCACAVGHLDAQARVVAHLAGDGIELDREDLEPRHRLAAPIVHRTDRRGCRRPPGAAGVSGGVRCEDLAAGLGQRLTEIIDCDGGRCRQDGCGQVAGRDLARQHAYAHPCARRCAEEGRIDRQLWLAGLPCAGQVGHSQRSIGRAVMGDQFRRVRRSDQFDHRARGVARQHRGGGGDRRRRRLRNLRRRRRSVDPDHRGQRDGNGKHCQRESLHRCQS
jgi:hypothetical protein